MRIIIPSSYMRCLGSMENTTLRIVTNALTVPICFNMDLQHRFHIPRSQSYVYVSSYFIINLCTHFLLGTESRRAFTCIESYEIQCCNNLDVIRKVLNSRCN